ncbi:RHS repeat-associated core domain-containing protein [Burkholderia stabilis]|uniref:RHS repeat-associated core domain-containing protein n=1 Tax=Burkholderia stabilis TaxID=95485 RepID=UPI001F0C7D08|nr:RHS repeat-associated core domain-containing protein [Burkholderia stabilis]
MGALTEAGLRAVGLPDSEVQPVWQILLRQRLITSEGHVQARLHQLAKAGTPVPGLSDSDTQSAAVHRAVAAVSRVPVHAATLSAERYYREHIDDPVSRPTDPVIRIALDYVDGFGRPLQGKLKAEGGLSAIVEDDGKLKLDASSGQPVLEPSTERWLTQGHVVYNAKGLPRQQYQPYYLNRPAHITDPKLDQLSASDALYYDAPGRVVQLTKADGNQRTSQYQPWYRIETDEMGAPVATVHDGRGLAVRTVQRPPSGDTAADEVRITRHEYDAAGRLVSSSDPRFFRWQQAGETTLAGNERHRYALSGHALTRESRDAGWQVDLLDAGGALWRSYTARDHQWRREYDALRRLSAVWLASGMAPPERCTERLYYGDDPQIDAETARRANVRGRLVSHYDAAGLRAITSYSLAGGIREEQRRFLLQRDWESDWPATLPESARHLESNSETSRWQQTALGDELMLLDAAGHRHRCTWHVSGRPSGSWLQLSGGVEQVVVSALSYRADHQLLHEQAGNGVTSDFEYDPKTQRLSRAQTTRTASGRAATVLQDLRYTYDPVGNVTELEDRAVAVKYFRNQRVAAMRTYRYDWLYQLVRATGREHANAGQEGATLPLPGTPGALVNYTRTFEYDTAGNLTHTRHHGATPYVLELTVSVASNRAVAGARDVAGNVEAKFDAQGNPHRLGSDQPLTWSADNRLSRAVQLPRAGGEDDAERYGYGGDGRRVRKWSSQRAGTVTHQREVRYLPGLERRTDTATGEALEVVSSAVAGQTTMRCLHWRANRPGGLDNDTRRYSVNDHLGSSCLEYDQGGQRLSAEEYYPYGGTAVWLPKSQVEGNYKFVRYSGKERDVSGLYDYGLRYYAPWLARWLNPDPAGTIDGLNLYRMVRNNPVTLMDPDGRMPPPPPPFPPPFPPPAPMPGGIAAPKKNWVIKEGPALHAQQGPDYPYYSSFAIALQKLGVPHYKKIEDRERFIDRWMEVGGSMQPRASDIDVGRFDKVLTTLERIDAEWSGYARANVSETFRGDSEVIFGSYPWLSKFSLESKGSGIEIRVEANFSIKSPIIMSTAKEPGMGYVKNKTVMWHFDLEEGHAGVSEGVYAAEGEVTFPLYNRIEVTSLQYIPEGASYMDDADRFGKAHRYVIRAKMLPRSGGELRSAIPDTPSH